MKSAFKEKWNSYTRQEKIVLPIAHLILLIFLICSVMPLFFAIVNSLKSVELYYDDAISLPNFNEIEWANYLKAFNLTYRNTTVLGMFFNTIYFVISFTFTNVFSSMCSSYVLSRFKFRGRNFLYGLAITIQIIPVFGTAGAAYLLMDEYNLIDNLWLICISGAGGFDYTFLILYSYFVSVDNAYSEAAQLDGASNFRIFISIMVPMVIPALMTMTLSTVITLWNDYSTALFYLPTHPTLSTGLYNLKSLAAYQEGGITTYFASIVISMIPILIFYFVTQRKIFTINVDGGVKG